MALVTKDPNQSALTLTTSDPSKGFGAGTLFNSVPEDQLTNQQKKMRYRSGAMQRPDGNTQYAKGGYVKAADGIAKRGKTKGRRC